MVKVARPSVDRRRGIDYVGVTINFIVHDGNGRFLLQKRSKKARDEHGNWDICGGALEFGEPIEDGVKRELKEELAAEAQDIKFITAYEAHREHKGNPTHWIALNHAVLADPAKVKINEPDKIDEIGWFTLATLPSPLHSQIQKALVPAKAAGIIK